MQEFNSISDPTLPGKEHKVEVQRWNEEARRWESWAVLISSTPFTIRVNAEPVPRTERDLEECHRCGRPKYEHRASDDKCPRQGPNGRRGHYARAATLLGPCSRCGRPYAEHGNGNEQCPGAVSGARYVEPSSATLPPVPGPCVACGQPLGKHVVGPGIDGACPIGRTYYTDPSDDGKDT